ncbi:GlxA family transcriptional regulator [Aliiroseovarius subalbicans]|uniref:GlxA family transcriptional regulator n=1 Tax=Aliiroseovarius subalbicans TaxID=2925840 RepID=UPI001F574AFE|nr:GlxA family transcriptional regulator [Aliiroseovarius subalbicans]MCI2398049.1 GlxA family transcriptional regulator [Aliiroseovarius subalbicans]
MKSAKNIFGPESAPLHVGVLVLDSCNMLSLSAVLDPMRAANRRAARDVFRWTLLTPDACPVTLTAGLPVTGLPLIEAPEMDALFVVAGFQLEEQSTPALLTGLRRQATRVQTLAGIDGGSWILARAGLLNGHKATTHWEDLERFAQEFPEIDAQRDRYVIDGQRTTTGGASPALDMMLHLIRARHGEALAMRVAAAFIYDPVHAGDAPQSLASPARLRARAPKVARAIRMMEQHLDDPPRIAQLAAQVGLTPRHLETRFRAALGTTPGAFFLNLRLSEARRLALDTSQPVAQIALATGFNSQAAFARAFKQAHGQSVSALRRGR